MKKMQRIIYVAIFILNINLAGIFGAPLGRSYNNAGTSSSANDPYQDNFDAMYSAMDLNSYGQKQKIKISLPEPPGPPHAPRPINAPNFSQYENDPNNGPGIPQAPKAPVGFGSLDINVQFPSYTPNVDDAFYDSDSGNVNYAYQPTTSQPQYSMQNSMQYSMQNSTQSSTQYSTQYSTQSSTQSSTQYSTQSNPGDYGGNVDSYARQLENQLEDKLFK
jgi:hypothetical protein